MLRSGGYWGHWGPTVEPRTHSEMDAKTTIETDTRRKANWSASRVGLLVRYYATLATICYYDN